MQESALQETRDGTTRPASIQEPEALLVRMRAGEERAFEECVRTNTRRMLAAARRILRNDDEAEDAVQEAFLQAFRGLERFAGEARLSTWLHRIAVNSALMRLRYRRRHPTEALADDDLQPRFDEAGHRLDVRPAWPEDSQSLLESKEVRNLVRQAIDRLPEHHRTVLVLRDIEGLENAEVADLLGIQPEAAKMRVHRARRALRTLLDPHLAGMGQ
jgi:RNA polymerase sigma-70 factor (ECF subfamily)